MKLDDLCAIKVMGWEFIAYAPPGFVSSIWDTHGGKATIPGDFSPSTSLDDALVCLERAAQGKGYSIYMFPEEKKPYDVELEVFKMCTDAKTLPLAMCICSLRAMGIPESEISLAME